MGTKQGNKRYNDFIYTASCIIIGLTLSGCTFTSVVRPLTVSADIAQQQYLDRMVSFIKKNDFNAAAADNRKMIVSFESRFHAGDEVLTNYIQQTKVNQMLLEQIRSDGSKYRSITKQIQVCNNQQKVNAMVMTSLKADKEKLEKKIVLLEQENHVLKEQIKQIKQIDLNIKKVP